LLPRPPLGCASATTPHFEIVPSLPLVHSLARRTLGVNAFDDVRVKVDAPLHPHSHPRTSDSTLPLRPTARLVHIRSLRCGGRKRAPPRVVAFAFFTPSSRPRGRPRSEHHPALLLSSTVGFHGSFRFATWMECIVRLLGHLRIVLENFASFWKVVVTLQASWPPRSCCFL
jgi:hypothetical protein